MKSIVLWVLLSVSCCNSFGQGINNLWILGYDSTTSHATGRTTLDFSAGSPSMLWSMRPMNFYLSDALISNHQGQLLFYTNGIYIANANDDTMLNGSGLNPSSYTTQSAHDGLGIIQSDIIIPFPDDSMKYYLFHVTCDSAEIIPTKLYYSVIDMNLDGGLGGVTIKNHVLLHSSFYCGELTACKHANGRDWWLISHLNTSYSYVKFLVTPTGVTGPFYQNIGQYIDLWNDTLTGIQQVVFSPDGNWFALYDCLSGLDLMHFDRCSGEFSNLIHVDINDSAYRAGAAFSPNSQVLYLSSFNYVFQFDLTATDIAASQTLVATWDGFYDTHPIFTSTFYLAQLMPDGKIYIGTGNGTAYLHVINYPDSVGLACNVCQHCLHLPTFNAETVPNYPNYFLGADTTSTLCDSLVAGVQNLITEKEINIFPNPAHDRMYVSLSQSMKIKTVHVLNALGEEMNLRLSFIKNGEYIEISTSSLSQGIYFLELTSDQEKVVKRFAKE